ncbi:MAG TPA: hypothetical protein PK876_10355, partial [Elusimicrobiota bacterium]|nr:hypothetical protein [Elusimicrobiota bacterium]
MTNISYDALGRKVGGMENSHVFGTQSDGQVVDITRTIETLRLQEDVTTEDFVMDPKLNIVFHKKNITSTRDLQKTNAWDSTGAVIRQLNVETVKTDMTPQGDYTETRREYGEYNGETLNKISQTTRSNVVLDGFGRMTSYTEESTQNGQPSTWTQKQVTGIVYSVDNNILQSREESVNMLGVTNVAERSKMTYDIFGRLKTYELSSASEADGIRSESRTVRDLITYNGLGDIAGYHEKVTRDGTAVVEDLNWSGTYNVFGLALSSRQSAHKFGKDESTGDILDITDTTNTYGMKYNEDGSLSAYTEEVNSSSSPDMLTINEFENIKYDNFSRTSEFVQTARQVSAQAVTHDKTGHFVINSSISGMNAATVTRRSNAVFDDLGGLTGYSETSTLLDGTGAVVNNTLTVRSQLTHHPMGQVLSYTDTITNLMTPGIITTINWEGNYDIHGRSIGYVENRLEKTQGGALMADTRTERRGVSYNVLNQMTGYSDFITTIDSDGNRSETETVRSQMVYNSRNNMTSYIETSQVKMFDNGGTLLRETTKNTLWNGAVYNELGQLTKYQQVSTTTNPAGTLNHTITTTWSGDEYNSLGQLSSYTETTHQEGSSLDKLELPTNWNELTADQRLAWLSNLTFVIGGTEYNWDEYAGVARFILNGVPVTWNELTSAQKVELLSTGQSFVQEQPISLFESNVLSVLNSTTVTRRSNISYLGMNITMGYTEDVSENGIKSTKEWQATALDEYGRATGYIEDGQKAGEAAYHVERAGILYNGRGLAISYTETSWNAASSVVTTSKAQTSYDALGRQSSVQQVTTQKGQALNEQGQTITLDTISTSVTENYTYDSFDRATGYQEVRFDGTTVQVDGKTYGWYDLTSQQQQDLRDGVVLVEDQSITVNTMLGIVYDLQGRQKGYVNVQNTFGMIRPAPAETIAEPAPAPQVMKEETTSVRTGLQYNANNQAVAYKEIATASKSEAMQTTTSMKDIVYNAEGQQVGYLSEIYSQGIDLDVISLVQRSGVLYNGLGQLAAYSDVSTENGLKTDNTTLNMTYDDQGRSTGYTSTILKTGQESRTYYTYQGRELQDWELSLVLALYPDQTVDSLLSSGVLKMQSRMEDVNETVMTTRSDVGYDALNRMVSYTDTTANADGTTTVAKMTQRFDSLGRVTGYLSETRQYGPGIKMSYQMDGRPITSETINEMLMTSGLTPADFVESVLGMSELGLIQVVETAEYTDKTTVSERSDIQYNANGQMVGYQDTTSDPETGLTKQTTNVSLTYNQRGQIVTSKSLTESQYDTGSVTTSETLMTNRYDAEGILLGAESVGTFKTVEAAVWTDSNGDGIVDRLVSGGTTTGSSRQTFGVRNGQTQLLFQLSQTTSVASDGNTTVSDTTTVYHYNPLGRLLGGMSTGKSLSDDGFGNVTNTQITQLLTAFQGETKVVLNISDSFTANLDGSDNHSVTAVSYQYNERGQVSAASGHGHFVSNERGYTDPEHAWMDGWDDKNGNGIVDEGEIDINLKNGVIDPGETLWIDANGNGVEDAPTFGDVGQTTGTIEQVFAIVNREARMVQSISTSHSVNVNGSITDQTMVTTNSYDDKGRLNECTAAGTSTSTSEESDVVTQGATYQNYMIINGNAKVIESLSITDTTNPNGSLNHSETSVHYRYDGDGKLTRAWGDGAFSNTEYGWTDTTLPPDGVVDQITEAGTTRGTMEQTYEIIGGQARQVSNISDSTTISGATQTRSRSVVNNRYNTLGQLTATSGYSSSNSASEVWDDLNQNGVWEAGETDIPVTISDTVNTYVLLAGQSIVVSAVSTTWGTDDEGGIIRDQDQDGYSWSQTTVSYSYDRNARLLDAIGSGTSRSTQVSWTDLEAGQNPPEGLTLIEQDIDGDGSVERGYWNTQKSSSIIEQDYEILDGQALLSRTFTKTWNTKPGTWDPILLNPDDPLASDGYSYSEMTVDNTYDSAGRLTASQGTGLTQSAQAAWNDAEHQTQWTDSNGDQEIQDGEIQLVWVDLNEDGVEQNGSWILQRNETDINQTYYISKGRALLRASQSTNWTLDDDQQRIQSGTDGYTWSQTTITYTYDRKDRLNGARGEGISESSSSSLTQELRQEDLNMDGDYTDDGETTETDLNGDGLIADYWELQSNRSRIEQTYRILQGRASMLEQKSISDALNAAGDVITRNENGYSHAETVTTYLYDDKGHMVSTKGTGWSENTSLVLTQEVFYQDVTGDGDTNDFGETLETDLNGDGLIADYWEPDTTRSDFTQDYSMLNGQSKLMGQTTTTHVDGKEGSVSETQAILSYKYDEAGHLISAYGYSLSVSDDGYYNLTSSETKQQYIVLRGEIKLLNTITDSLTQNYDETTSTSHMETRYVYDARGKLIDAMGEGYSSSDDLWGNKTTSEIKQLFQLIQGQARLASSRTTSDTVNFDDSTSHQESVMVNRYNALGQLLSAHGTGSSESVTVEGTSTDSLFEQYYVLINGQTKQYLAANISGTENIDGSQQHQETLTTYFYNSKGQGLYGFGLGQTVSDDMFGTITRDTLFQQYAFLSGQFRLVKTDTTSDTVDSLQNPLTDLTSNLLDGLGLSGVDWVTALADTPFIIPLAVHKQIYEALSEILNFSFTEILVQEQETETISEIFAADIQDAINQFVQSGVVTNIKSVEFITGTPTDSEVMDTSSFITWTSDGVVLIHEDVLKRWNAEGRDVTATMLTALLHENSEYTQYLDVVAAGVEITTEMIGVWHQTAIEQGYMISDLQENQAEAGAVVSASAFGSVAWGNILGQLTNGSSLDALIMKSIYTGLGANDGVATLKNNTSWQITDADTTYDPSTIKSNLSNLVGRLYSGSGGTVDANNDGTSAAEEYLLEQIHQLSTTQRNDYVGHYNGPYTSGSYATFTDYVWGTSKTALGALATAMSNIYNSVDPAADALASVKSQLTQCWSNYNYYKGQVDGFYWDVSYGGTTYTSKSAATSAMNSYLSARNAAATPLNYYYSKQSSAYNAWQTELSKTTHTNWNLWDLNGDGVITIDAQNTGLGTDDRTLFYKNYGDRDGIVESSDDSINPWSYSNLYNSADLSAFTGNIGLSQASNGLGDPPRITSQLQARYQNYYDNYVSWNNTYNSYNNAYYSLSNSIDSEDSSYYNLQTNVDIARNDILALTNCLTNSTQSNLIGDLSKFATLRSAYVNNKSKWDTERTYWSNLAATTTDAIGSYYTAMANEALRNSDFAATMISKIDNLTSNLTTVIQSSDFQIGSVASTSGLAYYGHTSSRSSSANSTLSTFNSAMGTFRNAATNFSATNTSMNNAVAANRNMIDYLGGKMREAAVLYQEADLIEDRQEAINGANNSSLSVSQFVTGAPSSSSLPETNLSLGGVSCSGEAPGGCDGNGQWLSRDGEPLGFGKMGSKGSNMTIAYYDEHGNMTTKIHMVWTGGHMDYRSTVSRDDDGNMTNIVEKFFDGTNGFVKYIRSDLPSESGGGTSYSLMAVGNRNTGNKTVAKQTWLENSTRKDGASYESGSYMTRGYVRGGGYNWNYVTKQSVMLNKDTGAVTFSSLKRDMGSSAGPQGVMVGDVPTDDEGNNWVANSIKIINGSSKEVYTVEYPTAAGAPRWLNGKVPPGAPSTLTTSFNFDNMDMTLTIPGFGSSVTIQRRLNGYVSINGIDGFHYGNASGRIDNGGGYVAILDTSMANAIASGKSFTKVGTASASLYGTVSWTNLLQLLNPFKPTHQAIIKTIAGTLKIDNYSTQLNVDIPQSSAGTTWQTKLNQFVLINSPIINTINRLLQTMNLIPKSSQQTTDEGQGLSSTLQAMGISEDTLPDLLNEDGTVTAATTSPNGQQSEFSIVTADELFLRGTITLHPLVREAGGFLNKTVKITGLKESEYTGATTHTEMTVVYNYNARGQLISASGRGTSVSNDGFGNITTSDIVQNYVILNGQARLKESITSSHTVNIDGSESWMDGTHGSQAMKVEYFYDAKGKVLTGTEAAARGTGVSISSDAFGSVTTTRTDQYFTSVAGQAKMTRSTSSSYTESVDGAKTYNGWEDPTGKVLGKATEVTYHYTSRGLLETGKNNAAYGYGESYTVDAFGNETTSVNEQFFTAVRNQAKLDSVRNSSVGKSVDGSVTVTDPYTIEYTYDAIGLLIQSSMPSEIHSTTTDAFGNITESWSLQTFKIVAGQAKMLTNTTWSSTLSVDGSSSDTDRYTTTYAYAEDTADNRTKRIVGNLLGAEAESIHSNTTDAFGNVTESWTEQTFGIIANQAKVLTSTNWSTSRSVDGAVTVTDRYTTTNKYAEDTEANRKLGIVGQLLSASATPIRSTTTDAFGNVTASTTEQVFTVIAGQAKVLRSIT